MDVNDRIKRDLEEVSKEYEIKKENYIKKMREKYPSDVPNSASNVALISGVFIENSFGPKVGECTPFFETEMEKVFVWTPEEDKDSVLIIQANEKVKDNPCWVTLASIVELSRAAFVSFEIGFSDNRYLYNWIYYFDPNVGVRNSTFYGKSIGGPTDIEAFELNSGVILKATDISDMAFVIELLCRDEKAYTATAALHSSFSLHYCCFICETGKVAYHDHLLEEPELWEHVSAIPDMEVAIVQAFRSVEAILGEPPNRNKKTKMLEFIDRWKSKLGLDPTAIYEKAGVSYLDFYYTLFFELRNASAHSYGNVHYKLLRKNTVASQCFATILLFEYIKKNALKNDEAIDKILFNKELLSRVSPNMRTCLTKKS